MTIDPEWPFPDVQLYRGDPEKPRNPDVKGAVQITERGCKLELLFDEHSGDAQLVGLRVKPAAGERLEASNARHLFPQIEEYLALARAALDFNEGDAHAAFQTLRAIGRPGRGHSDDFIRAVAGSYKALVAEGERYPVKMIAKRYGYSPSQASRLVSEARRRGYLPEKEARDAT